MTNAMFSTVPGDWDPAFIFAKAGVTNHLGYEALQDGTLKLGYRTEDADAVIGAIAAYSTAYAEERQKPAILARIGEIRAEKILAFTFNGMPLPLDLTTETRIGNAVLWLDHNPDRVSVNWDTGGRNFLTIPREVMLALGNAAGEHTQACFDHSKALADQVRAAADIDALAVIDLEAGWPGDPEGD